MLTMFVIISWKYFGFHMILLLAGLQGIPRELEEAAADRRRHAAGRRSGTVTLPLLGPTIRVSVFLSMIGALQLFDLDLGDHRGRTGQCLEHDGDVHGRLGLPPLRSSAMAARSRSSCSCCALVLALAYQRFVLRRDIDGAMTDGGG